MNLAQDRMTEPLCVCVCGGGGGGAHKKGSGQIGLYVSAYIFSLEAIEK